MLQIKNYYKSYEGHVVLEIDNLTVPKGIHWVIGKNGSGKSTFFKSIAGITEFKGKILFEGEPVAKVSSKLKINYAEAEAQLPDYLAGRDILSFVAKTKKGPANQLSNLVELFGIESFWKNSISTYSSGMLKKISLIIGFLGNPRLIILDEPFILIDAITLEKLYRLIREEALAGNTSFLISSHQEIDFGILDLGNTYLIENQQISLI